MNGVQRQLVPGLPLVMIPASSRRNRCLFGWRAVKFLNTRSLSLQDVSASSIGAVRFNLRKWSEA